MCAAHCFGALFWCVFFNCDSMEGNGRLGASFRQLVRDYVEPSAIIRSDSRSG